MSLVEPNAPAGPERRKQRGLRGFFQKYFTSYPDTPASSAPASRTSPASSIRATVGGAPGRGTAASPSHSPTASRPVTPLRSHHPPSGVTVADRPITQPRPERRRRRRRRTQSPVGLPIYSERPTEDEMSLFKSHDDAFGPTRIVVGIDEEDGEEGVEEISDDEDGDGRSDEERDDNDGDGEEGADSFFAMPPRRSFETTQGMPGYSRRRSSGAFAAAGPEDPAVRPMIRGRPRAASEPLGHQLTQQTTRSSLARSVATSNSNSPYLHGSSSPFASRSGLIELPPRPPSPPAAELAVSVNSTTSRFSFRPRHRSSRSSPVIPPSASSPVLPSSPSTSSFLGSGRPRSSTLQKLMSSSAGTSSASLAPPNALESGGAGAGAGRSPYGSLGSKASSSQVSLGGRSISAPLANSFVHSSFVFPKTGPTPEQVAFISSRQAIGAYGYGAGASPPPPLSTSPPEGSALPPPVGFGASTPNTSSDGLIAPVPVRGRARSGSGASQMSAGASPLSREVKADVPPEPVSGVAAADLSLDSSPPEPASDPPVLPPLSPLEGFSDLSLAFENRVEAFERVAEADETLSGSRSRRRPPDITTSAPTPTASAAPSPRIPSRTSLAVEDAT